MFSLSLFSQWKNIGVTTYFCMHGIQLLLTLISCDSKFCWSNPKIPLTRQWKSIEKPGKALTLFFFYSSAKAMPSSKFYNRFDVKLSWSVAGDIGSHSADDAAQHSFSWQKIDKQPSDAKVMQCKIHYKYCLLKPLTFLKLWKEAIICCFMATFWMRLA